MIDSVIDVKSPQSPDATAAPSDAEAAAAAMPRVLVVEDNDLTRNFVVEMIESFGYPVAAASNSLEAMRVLAQTPSLGLVFTDIVLPGLDGIVLADMVKQHRPKLKILYTTGQADIHQIRADAGIMHGDILRKPYIPELLRSRIKDLLG